MAEIVITEFMEDSVVAGLAADFDVLYDADLVDKADALALVLAGARALIVRNRTEVRGKLLARAGRLEVVGRLGVGLDNVDLDGCRARGIPVIPATGANADSVAEYVIAGIFMLLRRAFHSSAEVLAGRWPRTQLAGREVTGKRLGLVGFGSTARAVAGRARALGMEVTAADPWVAPDDPAWAERGVRPAPLAAVLGESHALSIHVPLTRETRGLVGTRALATMQRDAVLINASRGGVVDEAALAEALTAGRLAGALLDVFEEEPLSAGSVLDGVPNLILTPHIAGITEEANRRVAERIAAGVRRVLEGGS